MTGRPAVLLDRDGVIVEEVGYLSAPEQLAVVPGADEAIAALNRIGVPVAVITNQAGVARGYFPESRVHEVHDRLDQILATRGAKIDGYFYCPHHPTAGNGPYRRRCECRKPRPGLLKQAAGQLELDLPNSFMVGDKLTDLQAGAAAGCQTVLVRTGYGARVQQRLDRPALRLFGIAADLKEAVELAMPALLEIRPVIPS